MFKPHKIPKHLLMQSPSSRPWWLKLLLAVLLGAVLALAIGVSELSRAEVLLGHKLEWSALGTNQSSSGDLLFRSELGYARALHLHTDVQVQVNGMVAEVVMRQSFKNPSTDYLEGVYVFPLQEKTAVNAMTMIIGERKIVGKIREKSEAKKIYQNAKKLGKRAVLAEQQRQNLFKYSVANIAPGETITVELRYVQPVEVAMVEQNLQFSLRLPTTFNTRYRPSKSDIVGLDGAVVTAVVKADISLASNGWAQAINSDDSKYAEITSITNIASTKLTKGISVQSRPRTQPQHFMNLSLQLRAGLPLAEIDSPHHEVAITKHSDYHQIHFAEGLQLMDRDFIINWQAVAAAAPQAALFLQSQEQQSFALLMLQPPTVQFGDGQKRVPRELTFIVDTSGSMDGESIRQARAGLIKALDSLHPSDRFNIIEFNSNYRVLSVKPQSATAARIALAKEYVRNLQSGGGTSMAAPLLYALNQESSSGFVKQLVFITDGAINNESQLFELIHQNLGRARLFTVGIGSAPNSFFMRKAAQFGRGSFTYIADVNEVEAKVDGLFKAIAMPLLSNIKVSWPKHLKVEQWPQRLPDLYAGQPLVVLAKLTDMNAVENAMGEIKISGQSVAENGVLSRWQRQLQLPTNIASDNKGIAALWGREKIADLLDQKVRGADAAGIAQQVLKVALEQQLLSPYTSFIAVEEQPIRPESMPLHQRAMANTKTQRPAVGLPKKPRPRPALI